MYDTGQTMKMAFTQLRFNCVGICDFIRISLGAIDDTAK
ncbi:hypothetical protein EcE24377A_2206 [Escherichia coli O139:H28 str. E24377A]|uniref:Uncharacterized protein n=1 Tax=Escherichia coli O139:H28 (strain E24377A / ETEC) TaxID=331111 RepID=A7ZN96_ECO24|nr:hypothetical protein EcE24377A_2206 [Escherichia coli O139:H28 str. E24377A]